MPHATNMPFTGFQAVILCGPGVSLNTFTANPEEFPKALVPIANRPMVWYPLDWCYRMGITNIHLITPPASLPALSAALSQNPHLTSLPSPRADILAPTDLNHTTPTATILRLPEVRAAIAGDFLILPCDLVCELPGDSLLETWMVHQSLFGGGLARSMDPAGRSTTFGQGISGHSQRGGLAVYYETRGNDHVKGTETDFIITTALPSPPAPSPETSLRPHISTLLYATATDTLNDIMAEQKGLPLRHGMIRKNGRIRVLTTHRDAHIYLFPHWVMDWAAQNERFDSISEDVVGWWAKAGWQDGLAEKLHLGARGVRSNRDALKDGFEDGSTTSNNGRRGDGAVEIDLASMSSTHTSLITKADTDDTETETQTETEPKPPPILAYIHPTRPDPSFSASSKPSHVIRRVDTPALLLSTSLHIASLPSSSPLAHPSHVTTNASIAPHTTIHEPSTLVGPNTAVAKHCNIKASSIGANCVIEAGVKLTGCLLMDGVVIKEKAALQGCILGRRSEVGKGANLEGCQVPEQYAVPEGREAKGEIFSVGLEDDGQESDEEDDVEMEGA